MPPSPLFLTLGTGRYGYNNVARVMGESHTPKQLQAGSVAAPAKSYEQKVSRM